MNSDTEIYGPHAINEKNKKVTAEIESIPLKEIKSFVHRSKNLRNPTINQQKPDYDSITTLSATISTFNQESKATDRGDVCRQDGDNLLIDAADLNTNDIITGPTMDEKNDGQACNVLIDETVPEGEIIAACTTTENTHHTRKLQIMFDVICIILSFSVGPILIYFKSIWGIYELMLYWIIFFSFLLIQYVSDEYPHCCERKYQGFKKLGCKLLIAYFAGYLILIIIWVVVKIKESQTASIHPV